jgi:hypothetical protein
MKTWGFVQALDEALRTFACGFSYTWYQAANFIDERFSPPSVNETKSKQFFDGVPDELRDHFQQHRD